MAPYPAPRPRRRVRGRARSEPERGRHGGPAERARGPLTPL